MLADRYDKEQAELTEKIEQYEREGRAEHDQLDKIQDFIDEVSKYAGITELNYKILHQLIDKILRIRERKRSMANTSRKSRFSTALSAHWMPSSNKVRKVTSENYPTDSGREGELIFRLVYQQAGCKKPFSRLWLSSMEENAIREGFAHLKPSTEYDALYNAALCRERADWMVGINASRLFSCLYGQPLAVGRVMTPVLAMTVVREAAIAAFVPEKFYTVALELADGGTASSKRFAQKADAETLLAKPAERRCVATVQKMDPQGKIRKSAAALRPYHPCSGMPTVCWGLQRTADLGLCAEPV